MTSPLIPVILCGGSGTRLWPLSRETFPKQFLALGGDGISMLQATARRLDGLDSQIPKGAPIVVCNGEHRFLAAQQLQDAEIAGAKLVLEPVGRNTAPALTLAALVADPDAVMLAMPADHVMSNLAQLHAAVKTAWQLAANGAMVTFGIVADRPETGYGYIQKAQPIEGMDAFAIQSFAEKPSLEVAKSYLQSGEYLWNSGLFMVRADQWLKAMAALQPRMLQACKAAVDGSSRDLDFIRPDADTFAGCPADSIDYAVMEHLPRNQDLRIPARVVPMDAGWSDLGAWDALWDVLPRDAQGNAHVGQTLAVDTQNSLLFSETCLVATVGLDNIVVVETADAVLVADKRRTQDVKKIVAELKAHKRKLASTHRKVHRPWGWYDSIDSGERFQVKRIVVNPGAQLSLQMHHHRAEHWVVVKGTAEVTNGEKTFLLAENESTFIPLGHTHRLVNPGKVPLEIIEVQSGSYLGEDDIVRFEDTYGRIAVTAERN
ncbi:mannose-1-phosphate guanylyltransferase/mannose-6-phosphate isomerase [Paracidovorax avenae]|uniref:mannose-1-phosphate guanylyltransferase/mannose-6-phosphate isomerase n=1 Tax=Paracidovorax avenae TaxID=80867 RepID=UPI000D16CFFC|nr:mannose-1-phosphate guanylyltransferase/mannose-6-phosphate isomerase [Paracidovorax avenae]AVS87481.1 mannose-1-phosphate guanylyltransferase/mannose-6-phosphate isomerase [Paracidovorax avenae]AVT12024.1 mannose-1-phosphate guanylyltransferase/mannose-6-phosphate isomerase [Paracidovorax avenae]